MEAVKARADRAVMADPARDRGEILWEAKFKAHETVECFFQVLFRLRDAYAVDGRPPLEKGEHSEEFRQAA